MPGVIRREERGQFETDNRGNGYVKTEQRLDAEDSRQLLATGKEPPGGTTLLTP